MRVWRGVLPGICMIVGNIYPFVTINTDFFLSSLGKMEFSW